MKVYFTNIMVGNIQNINWFDFYKGRVFATSVKKTTTSANWVTNYYNIRYTKSGALWASLFQS